MSTQPDDGSVVDADKRLGEVGLVGRWRLVKAHAFVLFLEHSIGAQRVKMDVQIEAATKALWEGDGACFRAFDIRAPLGHPGDFFREDAADGAEDVGLGGGETAKLERKRQHMLANGDIRQNAVRNSRAFVAHAAGSAAGAEAALPT